MASVHTASSTGSKGSGKGSGKFHKKLNGFFGEDYPGDNRKNGNMAEPFHYTGVIEPVSNYKRTQANVRDHNGSGSSVTKGGSADGRPASPAVGRLWTPQQAQPKPSSEVTPWEYQVCSHKPISAYIDYLYFTNLSLVLVNVLLDCSCFFVTKSFMRHAFMAGTLANIQKEPADSADNERSSLDSTAGTSKNSGKSHRLGFAGHRHRSSRDDSKLPNTPFNQPLRAQMSREDYFGNIGRTYTSGSSAVGTSSTKLVGRATSPSPRQEAGQVLDTVQRSPAAMTPSTKRGILDKLRRKDKTDKVNADVLRDLPSSTTSIDRSLKSIKSAKSEQAPSMRRKGTTATLDMQSTPFPQTPLPPPSSSSSSRKDHGPKIPFKSKKGPAGPEPVVSKDPNQAILGANEALFSLDTDLSQMEGIVNTNTAEPTPPINEIFAGGPEETATKNELDPQATWDAPDSWAVKRVNDDNIARLREIGEAGTLPNEHEGPSYSVRIYRIDSTYTTLSVGLNTTVAEIIAMLGKKALLVDELANYQIVMKKGDASRQLGPGERPLVIQKKLLEQVGYTSKDHIEEIGRDENSYLCRFTFLLAKMSGYSALVRLDCFQDALQMFATQHMLIFFASIGQGPWIRQIAEV